MALATLTHLRQLVLQRTGDEEGLSLDVSGSTANTTIATLPQIDEAINDAIFALVERAESAGFFPLNDSGAISVLQADVDALTREFTMFTASTGCVDATGDPNLRHIQKVERTDGDYPIPCLFPDGGDFRSSEFQRFYSTVQPRLYLRYPYIGFIDLPMQTMTLTIYYTPIVPRFAAADGAVTLTTKGLQFLHPWKHLVSAMAGMALLADREASQYMLLERTAARVLQDFDRSIAKMTTLAFPRERSSRWDRF